MARVFISHHRKDRAAAERLLDVLKAEGVDVMFLDFDAERGVSPGRDWEQELYSELRKADAVVFFNSPYSLESKWCFAELTMAKALGKVVVPVMVSGSELHPLLTRVQFLDLESDEAPARLREALRLRDRDPQPPA